MIRSAPLVALLVCAGAAGCSCEGQGPSQPQPSASGPSSTTAQAPTPSAPGAGSSAAPSAADAGTVGGIPADKVAKEVNPDGRAPHTGPTGTLRGVVRVAGDEPPTTSFPIPAGCGAAAATYGKLFRVGQDKTLADVLVAVTGYDGFVPAHKPSVELTINECAFSSRTVALTYGQTLEVRNRDGGLSYLPMLEGARAPATLVAIPGGDPVKLFAPEPRRYRLIDQMGRTFMVADVFVLRYATTAVTDLSGRYEIGGIPVGKVKVSALLPAAKMKAMNQELEIKAGDNAFDITIEFDAAKDAPSP